MLTFLSMFRPGRRVQREARSPRALLAQPPPHQRRVQRRRRTRRSLSRHHRPHERAQEAGPVAHHAPGTWQ